MDATEYAELVAAERSAAAALTVDEPDDVTPREWRALNDTYKAAEQAREAAFVAWNVECKQHAIDVAANALTESEGASEEEQLVGALVGARKVWEYMGASREAALQYAMRAVESACGKPEEHHTIGLGEA